MPRPASSPIMRPLASAGGTSAAAARKGPSAYAAPCPVCDGLALLMVWPTQQRIECNSCGSFDVASGAARALRQQPPHKRLAWLDRARSENRIGGRAVIRLQSTPFSETGTSRPTGSNEKEQGE